MRTGSNAVLDYVVKGWAPPRTGPLYSATSFQAAHFDFESLGTTGSSSTVTLHGGAYQIAPKQN